MSAHSDCVVADGNEVGGWVIGDQEDAAEAGESGLKVSGGVRNQKVSVDSRARQRWQGRDPGTWYSSA